MILQDDELTVVIICVIWFLRPVATFVGLFVWYFNGNFVAFLFVCFCAILFWYFVALRNLVVATVLLWYLVILWYLYIVTLLFGNFVTFFSVVIARLTMFLVMGGTLFFVFITCLSFVGCFTMLLLFVGASFFVMGLTMRDFNFLTNCFIIMFVLG